MLKVLKFLRESFISVVIIILLLIVQASGDLTLPDYTSKIVNVGIQQGGIEKVAPSAIREEKMNDLLIFTSDDEEILKNYTLVSKESLDEKEYEKLVNQYPKLEEEKLYIQNKVKKEEQEKLDSILAKPIVILYNLDKEEFAGKIKEQMLSNMPDEQKKVMQNMSMLEIIKNMPKEQQTTLLDKMSEQLDSMQESILEQSAIKSIKQEYIDIGMNEEAIQNKYIIITGLKMLIIAFIIMVSAITIMGLSARVGARLARTLRDKVFKKVLSFSNEEFTQFSTASLITRSTNDIQQIQNLIGMLFRVVVYSPIIGIGGFVRVLHASNDSMAWIIGIAVLAIIFVVGTLFIVAMPKFKKLQELIDKLNLVAREILTGLPVIRAFNTEKYEENRFDIANKNLTKVNLFVNRAMSIMMPMLTLIMNGITLLIIWVGAHNIEEGNMQVGDMMAFIQYTMQIVMSFLMISMMSIMLPRASVSAKRITEILETKESIKDPKEAKNMDKSKKGLVEFKNVSFRYPDADEDILTDINFTAKPGQTTAIIGSTGSGKSTVVNLIPRFYDVTKGELLIDGVNIKELKQKDLRKAIGFVPQKGILFSGTIKSNIKYGNPDITDEQMVEAAEIAQSTEFIEAKPDKYDSEISQGGTNVSGGQKQRLSIARAIAINPEIFVFDDSFSALDYKTDVALRAALAEKTSNKTVIIVAQRISTILHADQIIVLDEGKVVGIGTHKELMKNNEVYQQIAMSQLSKEELEDE